MEILTGPTHDRIGTDFDVIAGYKEKISVLVVDDHKAFRNGIMGILQNYEDIEVIGEAADGNMATILARQVHPNVILMDFSMPGIDGVQATRVIHSELPDIQIIGLSMFEDLAHAAEMLFAGAVTYVAKGCAAETLLDAIRAAGDNGIDPQ
jgi:DNA-binding NarL/FixJ family response regulator